MLEDEIKQLLNADYLYVDNKIDPLNTSVVIASNKSYNLVSVARYRGDCSAIHYIISEWPSILPKNRGLQEKRSKFFEFRDINDIIHWMDKYIDSTDPFYPDEYKKYYKGLEDKYT
jgi:hypothetical protein